MEGKDFLKAIYLPNDWLTVAVISNLARDGLHTDTQVAEEKFKSRHALKIDMIGSNYNTSIILSRKEGGNTTFGGYIQKTVSDALIMYFDMTLNRGNSILYPKLDPEDP